MLKSITLIVGSGIVIKELFKTVKIPPLLGLIAAGLLLGPYAGNFLDTDFLKFSPEIRLLALIIILLRAGLGLNLDILKRIGLAVLKISLLPCLLEAATIFIVSFYLLGFSFIEAGMLSFIVAAVSPALIVPAMLDLREQGFGMNKGIPVIVLAGASVDNILAVTLFSIFSAMAVSAQKVIAFDLALIPVKIAGGICVGLIFGFIRVKIFTKLSVQKTEEVAILICVAILAVLMGEAVSFAGLLAVMAIGFILVEKGGGKRPALYNGSIQGIWLIAELFLFILIGTEIDITAISGSIAPGLLIVIFGLAARTAGVFIATIGSKLSPPERLFCAISFLPKATVQAALGGLPLAMGMPQGEVILAIAVLAIIITTPIGAWGIKLGASRFLERPQGNVAAQNVAAQPELSLVSSRIELNEEARALQVKEAMTREVQTVHPRTTVKQVVEIMSKANISGLPVVDDNNRLVGVISESDILQLPQRLYLTGYHLELFYYNAFPDVFENELHKSLNRQASELMTRKVITVREDTEISEVIDLMMQNKINRLPVTRGQKLVGIVTRTDLINLLHQRIFL